MFRVPFTNVWVDWEFSFKHFSGVPRYTYSSRWCFGGKMPEDLDEDYDFVIFDNNFEWFGFDFHWQTLP